MRGLNSPQNTPESRSIYDSGDISSYFNLIVNARPPSSLRV
jgi:hypothetical protein